MLEVVLFCALDTSQEEFKTSPISFLLYITIEYYLFKMNQDELKEQLLTTEILNKGFDPNDFIEFVSKHYPSMEDSLSVWDYNELGT